MKSLSNLKQELILTQRKLSLAQLDIFVCETAVGNGLTHFFKVEPGKRPAKTSLRSCLARSRRIEKRAEKRINRLTQPVVRGII